MQTGICTKVETKDFFFKQNLKLKKPEKFFFLMGSINDKRIFFCFLSLLNNCCNIVVYARPYIDGVPTHSKQQVAVDGHGGQSAK
jgi:hypothetical protein